MSAKLKSIRPLLLLIIAILTLFGPALLRPDLILFPTFSPFSDLMIIHWPKARLMAESWQAGLGLPYWSPLILSGMPLAANQLAMLFYPPAWLFLVGPVEPVFNLLFIFHLFWGGLGVYLSLREGFNLSRQAALLGSLTFALNGKWLAHIAGGHVSMAGAIGWLPWILFGMLILLGETRWRRGWGVMVVAVALAMQILTHTLILIYSVYLIGGLVVWYLLTGNERWSGLSRLASLFLAVLAGLGLAGLLGAVQLWPLLELARYSNRSLSLQEAGLYAVSPLQLVIGLLLPSPRAGHELIIYPGLIPLLLAFLGLTRPQRWRWFFAGLLLFSALFALGPATPLQYLFYKFAPGFSWVRTPARMFFVGNLALSVLAGFGLDRLQDGRWPVAQLRWLTRLAVAGGSVALLIGLGLALGFGQLNRAALALALLVPAGLIIILLRSRRIISFPTAFLLLGLLLYLDLASFGFSLFRFVPLDAALRPGQTVAAYLAQKPGHFRVYSPSYSLPGPTAAAANLQLADGVEPVHLAVYDHFMAAAGGYGDASFSVTIPHFGGGPLDSALKEVEPDLKLLGLLNVKYLASAFPMDWPGLTLETELDGTYIYQNDQALPRAWIAPATLPGEVDWLNQLKRLDVTRTVIIPPNAPSTGGEATSSPVTITHYSPNLIELEVGGCSRPGCWLVVSEIWYPGWEAIVDGTPQAVEPVNGLLRGVYLAGAGPYRVVMAYHPRSISGGGWTSGLTAAALILAGLGMAWYGPKTTAKNGR